MGRPSLVRALHRVSDHPGALLSHFDALVVNVAGDLVDWLPHEVHERSHRHGCRSAHHPSQKDGCSQGNRYAELCCVISGSLPSLFHVRRDFAAVFLQSVFQEVVVVFVSGIGVTLLRPGNSGRSEVHDALADPRSDVLGFFPPVAYGFVDHLVVSEFRVDFEQQFIAQSHASALKI